MPVFALFFPLPLAIASTAVVHLATNIFQALLVGRWAQWKVVFQFGVPAALFSALGAYFLGQVSDWPPLMQYSLFGHSFSISAMGLMIGSIVVVASLFEFMPSYSDWSFPQKYTPLGGALSGFFGGISGYQGMLRSAFLIRSGLDKQEFIGTGVISSIMVDTVRIMIYGWTFYSAKFANSLSGNSKGLILAASLTAFFGAYLGSLLVQRITMKSIQVLVSVLLFVLGLGIAMGII